MNYDVNDMLMICGLKLNQIVVCFGYFFYEEVVYCDNLFVFLGIDLYFLMRLKIDL